MMLDSVELEIILVYREFEFESEFVVMEEKNLGLRA